MNRVFKQYTLRFKDPFVKAATVAFSSRPAFVSSKDDYYINSAYGVSNLPPFEYSIDRNCYSAALAHKKLQIPSLIELYITN